MKQRIDGELEVGGAGGGNVTVNVARSPRNERYRFSTLPLSGLTVETGHAMKLSSVSEFHLTQADQKTVIHHRHFADGGGSASWRPRTRVAIELSWSRDPEGGDPASLEELAVELRACRQNHRDCERAANAEALRSPDLYGTYLRLLAGTFVAGFCAARPEDCAELLRP